MPQVEPSRTPLTSGGPTTGGPVHNRPHLDRTASDEFPVGGSQPATTTGFSLSRRSALRLFAAAVPAAAGLAVSSAYGYAAESAHRTSQLTNPDSTGLAVPFVLGTTKPDATNTG